MNPKTRRGIIAGAVLDNFDQPYLQLHQEALEEIKPSRINRRHEAGKKREAKRKQREDRKSVV